jgi:dipeptidyl aminopeptidase/acylaminoacyl peptidase
MQELQITSSLDESQEPVLFAEGKASAPLLVMLHSWSADRFNHEKKEALTKQRGWHLLLPEFRGPNLVGNPRCGEACASELAQQDILDAVTFVRDNYKVGDQIFLLGGSGGGHMSLMMAAAAPQLWTAVSSWCPITDLAKWRLQNPNYRPHIEACCGGVPEDSAEVVKQYAKRSPLSYVAQIAQATVYIHHGKSDPSVPCSHTFELYQDIFLNYPDAKVYGEIFPGGHDFYPERAVQWFETFLSNDSQNSEITG